MPTIVGIEQLPIGPARPATTTLEKFWEEVCQADINRRLPDAFDVRWFGTNELNTEETVSSIAAGVKSSTFRLAVLVKAKKQRLALPGDVAVLIDWSGSPRLAVQYQTSRQVPYADVTTADIAGEGQPELRRLDCWRDVHRTFWTSDLGRFGMSFDESMLVVIESFGLLHARGLRAT